MEFMIPFAHADIAGGVNFADERVSDDLDYGRDPDDFIAPFDCGQLDADLSLFGDGALGAAVGNAASGSGGQSNCSAKARRDRSKTLVSERKRRVRMKEKLYELRSIVPTISKMDKASIIGDAVMYVKDLQSQAKKLEEEISMIQCSFSKLENPSFQTSKRSNMIPKSTTTTSIVGNKIIQVKACEVGEGRFHVKVKGNISSSIDHVSSPLLRTSSLYSALESLSCFDLESSNFSLVNEGFLFTMTINGGDFTKEISAASMELWLMGALLREGFQLMQTATLI